MIKVKWSQLDVLCRAIERVAGPDESFWVEHASDVVAGARPDNPLTPCHQRVAGEDGSEVLACVSGRSAHAWIDLFAAIVRADLAHQLTIADMAAATARTWRQMNALLAMASSTSLGLEPGKTIQRVFDLLARATRFLGGIAIVRLPGTDECIRLDANGIQRLSPDTLRGLEQAGSGTHTFGENDAADPVLEACRALLDPHPPAAVARLETEHENFGWLIAACDERLSSDDLKLFGAAARIVAVAIENTHTLSLARETARGEVEQQVAGGFAERAPAAMFRVARDGQLEYANEYWSRMTGVPLEAVADGSWLAIVHPADRPRIEQEWWRFLAEGTPFRVEHRCLRTTGEEIWLRTEIVSLEGDKAEGYVGAAVDITERKQLEAAVNELEAEIEQLLAEGADGGFRARTSIPFHEPAPRLPSSEELACDPPPLSAPRSAAALPDAGAGPIHLSTPASARGALVATPNSGGPNKGLRRLTAAQSDTPFARARTDGRPLLEQRPCRGHQAAERSVPMPRVEVCEGQGLLERLVAEFAAENEATEFDDAGTAPAEVVRRSSASQTPAAAEVHEHERMLAADPSYALVARTAAASALRARLLESAPEAKPGSVRLLGENASRSRPLLPRRSPQAPDVGGIRPETTQKDASEPSQTSQTDGDTAPASPSQPSALVARPFSDGGGEQVSEPEADTTLSLLISGLPLS